MEAGFSYSEVLAMSPEEFMDYIDLATDLKAGKNPFAKRHRYVNKNRK